MFFLARAAVCIGLVAAAASQAGGPDLATALGREAKAAAGGAGRACLASRECLQLGSGVLAAASPLALPAVGVPRPGRPAAAARAATLAAARPSPTRDRARHWRSGTGQAI